MATQHAFQQIRLHLVHLEEFPTRAARHRCGAVATNAGGHIYAKLWGRFRNYRRARRLWRNELDHIDSSIRGSGGSEHPCWVFDYESGYRFGSYMFLPGEYDAPRYED
jgi:hypothetical protein